ncbi:MAG TPA: RHS repeat-associated core domain-containing protein, partial [Candidatus Angelobacter sp.]|nr:RHS repeat-associated core domain-containing protein [Candidatus Angelobacter sp.]
PDYKSLTYDGMGRPLVQTTGGGGQTSLTYNEATLPFTIVSSVKLDSAHSVTGTTVYDGLGRTQQTQLNSDPAGADLIDIGYDAAGHQNSVSNPHRSGTAATDGVTQTQYDALGRVTQTTQPDGSVGRVLYSGNCTTATDEAGKSRKSCSDALGRLTSVFEDPAGLNYETDYQYDALGNLLRVDQKGSSPSDSTQWRSRTFTYDSLSRLLTAMNPESGTIGYQYDANGNLTQKTAPAENQTGSATVTTTYAYDALNRLTETSHSDGTPIVLYGYDETSGWGNALVNTIGRVSSATTFKNFGQPYIQGTVFSYDSMGRTINEWECIPSSCAPNFSTYHISAAYDLAGNMTSLTYPDTRVVGFRYNTANRLNQVQFTQYQGAAPPGGTFYYWNAPDANFSPNGTPLLVSLGNPTDENVALNNRLQLQQKSVVSSNLGAFANHVFNYGTSNNNGDLLGVADQISSAYTQTFTYDSLNRLATAGESRWGNSYVYDAWGNFTQQNVSSGSSFSHQFQADGNNRLVGYSYDAAGNLLNDKAHAYIYDGANRLVNVDSGTATYTYDSNGERVRKDTASGSTEYISFGGEIIAERNVSNGLWSDYIFANGKRIAMAYTYDNELHLHGVNCSSCGSQYADFLLPYAQGYNGYVIRSGDKLIFEQYQPTGVHGGMYISFTDGTGMLGQVNDSDGQPVANDGIENVTHFRTVDLSSFAGKTINLVSFHLDPSTAAGAWDLFFDSAVLTSADGSVRPFWTHEETVTLTPGATSGISGLSYEVRKSLGTIPILTTTFYHDDQIGSSRLMTDGFGMPVWQGTFLPYGEEYNSELTANHYKFTGKERDAETGLDYFGARYYSSGVGRFVTPDWAAKAANVPYAEFADPQSLNLYEYVRDIPTTKVDPDGHLVLQQDPQNQSSEQRRKEFDDQEQELEDKIRNFLEKLDNATSFRGWKTGAQIAAEKAAKEAQSRALWGILYPNLAYPEIQIGSVVPLGLGSAARATELADAMGKTKNFVTIAVTETKEGTTIVSSSENALRPAVRGLLREGEVAAEGPGHAEITGARTAEQMGLTPTGTAASRGICQGCWDYLKAAGIKALSALKDKVIP